MAYKNVEDGRKYQRDYYSRNRERINAKKRHNRALNPKRKRIIVCTNLLSMPWK